MPIAIDMKYWFEDAIFKHRGKSPKVLRYLFLSAEYKYCRKLVKPVKSMKKLI